MEVGAGEMGNAALGAEIERRIFAKVIKRAAAAFKVEAILEDNFNWN